MQRAALTLSDGILYVAYAGYADTDPYHGWIIGFDPRNLQPLPDYIFNTTPNSTTDAFGPNAGEGGIWMAGCGFSVDSGNNLYFVTGNGSFNAFNDSGGSEYGDTFLKLSTSRGLSVVDYFTPYNQDYLGSHDIDVGSGGVLLLPDQAGSVRHLMVAGGKEGTIYLLNRDMFTADNNHYDTSGSGDAVLQTLSLNGGVFSTPGYFDGRIYYAATGDALKAFAISNGRLSEFPVSLSSRIFGYPGATPSVSANGTRNGIVWVIQREPAALVAYDAGDLNKELYSSDATGGCDDFPGAIKFTVPTVANGKVYVGGRSALSVFGLLGGDPQGGGNVANDPPAASYSGLFFEPDALRLPSSGSIQLRTTTKGGFSGKLLTARWQRIVSRAMGFRRNGNLSRPAQGEQTADDFIATRHGRFRRHYRHSQRRLVDRRLHRLSFRIQSPHQPGAIRRQLHGGSPRRIRKFAGRRVRRSEDQFVRQIEVSRRARRRNQGVAIRRSFRRRRLALLRASGPRSGCADRVADFRHRWKPQWRPALDRSPGHHSKFPAFPIRREIDRDRIAREHEGTGSVVHQRHAGVAGRWLGFNAHPRSHCKREEGRC